MAQKQAMKTASVAGAGGAASMGPRVWRGAGLEWVKSLAIAIALALAIRWIVAEPFRIPSGSMEPTLHGDPRMFHGDRVFVNKFAYGTRFPLNGIRIPFTSIRLQYANTRIWRNQEPKRWDIVVFKAVESGAVHTTLVKRVVGLPGERIHIADGKVYVNGKALELPPDMPRVEYTSTSWPNYYGIGTDDEHAVVPADCYLLLGDNSAQSRDGRYFGWVSNERILGRVSCIWWPIPRWRDFTGFSHTWWWQVFTSIVGLLLALRLFVGRSWARRVPRGEGSQGVDHLFINRWAYGIPVPFTKHRISKGRMPNRGDLVLYRTGNKSPDTPEMAIGYVAGLPGERVAIDAGQVVIDGQPVEIAGLAVLEPEGTGPYGRSKSKEHSLVPADSFFILRADSAPGNHWDSRTLGWIMHDQLMGRAVCVWWPLRGGKRISK